MSGSSSQQRFDPFDETGPRALVSLLSEFERARAARVSATRRMVSLSEVIQELIALLPDGKRSQFQKQFDALKKGTPAESKGGEAYGQVVQLFGANPKRVWTVADILGALKVSDSKPIYNALNYLTRTGRLMRLGRGRYIVRDVGVGLEVDDTLDVDDGTSRANEHDV